MQVGASYEADLVTVTEELARLVRRLRSLSPHAWASRRGPVQDVVAGLVEISGELDARSLAPPAVADYVLADVVAVVGGDVIDRLTAEPSPVVLKQVEALIAGALDRSR